MKSKSKHLDAAELIDNYRIFPRLFLLSCFIWTVAVGQQLLSWYVTLAKEERSVEATGFASIVFLGILGFLKLVYSTYTAAGRAWGAAGTTTSSSTTTDKTTVVAP